MGMKFFERQRVDQVGITAVTLQKILLFLMILSLLSFLNGGFLSFLLCLLGFVGAYKRNTGLLRAYFIISVTLIVLAFVFMVISSFSAWNNISYDSSSEYSGSPSTPMDSSSNAFSSVFSSLASSESSSVSSSESSSVSSYESSSVSSSESSSESSSVFSSVSSSESNSVFSSVSSSESNSVSSSESWLSSSSNPIVYFSSSSSSSSSYYEDNYTAFVFLAILLMVWVFFIVYLKVYSLVLANRLRKMILLSATELPTTKKDSNVHEFAPANTSCAVPEPETHTPAPASPQPGAAPFHPAMFTPGFAPYPMMPQGMMPFAPNGMPFAQNGMPYAQHGMPFGQPMPYGQYPHVYFGQQPVFYSYAPTMPQSPTMNSSEEEKL